MHNQNKSYYSMHGLLNYKNGKLGNNSKQCADQPFFIQ